MFTHSPCTVLSVQRRRRLSRAGLLLVLLPLLRVVLLVLLLQVVPVAAQTCQTGSYNTGLPAPGNCLPCPAGSFCPDGASPPLPCPIRFACPGLGLSFPQLCGSGHGYCPVVSLASPQPCPAGTMSTPGASECVAAIVSTMAGGGGGATGGFADGTGTAAAFKGPFGAAVDASGNVLVADASNSRLRRVTPSGGM